MKGFSFDDESSEFAKTVRSLIGPGQIDVQIRQAIQWTWLTLGEEDRTLDRLTELIRESVDRGLQDFQTDRERFGGGDTPNEQ